ncbi:MAG: DNA translocase FtsK, partial [Clostridia bacterium]|nr:DNA translocase FtsK [Clostridia bacterium]
ANLVDDIALNLAATGVRIEAPIPGKSAVGIEVPNKTASTVYLRSLLESPKFKEAKSNVTACLGSDVAGNPIIFDISKMPHLLIAGATGMGKSVCINSIIISLLYKALPSEVKLLLIDPKKVEFNIYKDIPHLIAPIVCEPKKSAGALIKMVEEMERRFELIEEVGVRDIKSYNEITAGDPDREHLPQIVIIIDELADLMMTTPDDVENSICRLAQKARAAGMHIIIGTQRPSVDVITGLIKANIPSRIAFTVASQVDSRTIIDIAGAEKLIGRGDMLYAPVGAAKPMRVQGAFVSDSEVESVCEFIKTNTGKAEYDNNIVCGIEEAAAKLDSSKKGGTSADLGGADDGSDPMLRPAIELAIDCGKISTSLIQRRLSLGYGRAAKLIDKMEQLGYVTPQDGQKPREVLITKQMYMEMVVNNDIQ